MTIMSRVSRAQVHLSEDRQKYVGLEAGVMIMSPLRVSWRLQCDDYVTRLPGAGAAVGGQAEVRGFRGRGTVHAQGDGRRGLLKPPQEDLCRWVPQHELTKRDLLF